MKYEYGVVFKSEISNGQFIEPHRFGMREAEADTWIKEWEEGGGRKGSIVKIRRPVYDWELAQWKIKFQTLLTL